MFLCTFLLTDKLRNLCNCILWQLIWIYLPTVTMSGVMVAIRDKIALHHSLYISAQKLLAHSHLDCGVHTYKIPHPLGRYTKLCGPNKSAHTKFLLSPSVPMETSATVIHWDGQKESKKGGGTSHFPFIPTDWYCSQDTLSLINF